MYKEKLKYLRTKYNISKDTIAFFLNINKTTYSNYEKEISIMPIYLLNELCNYFDISIDYIFNFTNKEKYNNLLVEINLDKIKSRLTSLLYHKHLYPEDLETLFNCSSKTIDKYIKGITIIPTKNLYNLCLKYNLSADFILGKTNNPNIHLEH